MLSLSPAPSNVREGSRRYPEGNINGSIRLELDSLPQENLFGIVHRISATLRVAGGVRLDPGSVSSSLTPSIAEYSIESAGIPLTCCIASLLKCEQWKWDASRIAPFHGNAEVSDSWISQGVFRMPGA
jgi:hypothetical protein